MKCLFAITLLVATSLNIAVAENTVEPQQTKPAKPQMQLLMEKVSPMPMLMATLVKEAATLKLTEQQRTIFAKWRKEHMAPAITLANSILNLEQQINTVALEGSAYADVEALLNELMQKRLALATKMLECRDNTKKTLSASQWQQLTELYNAKKHI